MLRIGCEQGPNSAVSEIRRREDDLTNLIWERGSSEGLRGKMKAHVRACVNAGRYAGTLEDRSYLRGLVRSWEANLHSLTGRYRPTPQIKPFEGL